MMYSEIFQSFLFGMTIGLAVGPIGLLIIYNGMKKGFRVASQCALGASLADFTFALIAFFASAHILRPLVNDKAMIIRISSWILILFGVYMIVKVLSNRQNPGGDLEEKPKLAKLGRFKNPVSFVYFLTLANPLTIILFIGFAGQNVRHISILQGIIFSLALFLGNMIIQLILASLGKMFGKLLKGFEFSFYLSIISGFIIMIFGVSHLVS